MGTFILMFKNVFIFVALAIPGFILAKSKYDSRPHYQVAGIYGQNKVGGFS
jgi:hypothetical protein